MTEIPQLGDGVYLNLSEENYFGQRGRLGSSDISRLFLTKEGFWWKSEMNPDKPQDDDDTSPAQEFGKALHAIVLEGDAAYRARVATFPDKDVEKATHGKKFCVTVKDIMEGLEARGFNPKANQGKDFLIEYSKSRAPDLIMWDTLVAGWELANKGKIKLTEVEDRQIQIMAAAVRNHSQMGKLFHYGPDHVPLAEVSIFWTDQHGIKRRGRLDQMLPQSTIDVKTLQNVAGRPLSFAAGEHCIKMGYHVQMADHHVARTFAYRFITEGKVYDGVPVEERTQDSAAKFARELAWIKRFPVEAPHWDYAWIFYQKPDAKKGIAPIVFPWAEDYADADDYSQGDLHRRGIRGMMEAVNTYRRCMKEFGPDTPWTLVAPVHTSLEGATNRVYLPGWTGLNEFMPGEDEYL